MEDIREMFDSAKKELRKRGGLVGWGACGVLGSIFGRRTGVGVLVGVQGERDFWGGRGCAWGGFYLQGSLRRVLWGLCSGCDGVAKDVIMTER